MSHPKTQRSNLDVRFFSNGPRCSIVRYDMHLPASRTYGSAMAPVGHASMHAVHDPHISVSGSATSRSRDTIRVPRNTQDPNPRVMTFVCFPIQPTPAREAQTLSITGPVST